MGSPQEACYKFADFLPVYDMPLGGAVVAGRPSSVYGAAVIAWIETAVGLALSGAAEAVVTGPIAKAPLYQAGFRFPATPNFWER